MKRVPFNPELIEPPRRRGAEEEKDSLIENIIGAAIEVHKALGPGLLESAYEECVCYELMQRKIQFLRQVPLPLQYKVVKLDVGYRLDIIAERRVIIELKTVEKLIPIHEAQILTYLKLTGLPVGLIINFNVALLRDGIKRISNTANDNL